MVQKMIAYCGVNCCGCLAYQATKSNDSSTGQRVADEWNAKHNWGLKAEDINCDGCLPGKGRLFSYCSTCEARQCGIEKDLSNCASCSDYACNKLTAMSWFEERGKPNLDRIRRQNHKKSA